MNRQEIRNNILEGLLLGLVWGAVDFAVNSLTPLSVNPAPASMSSFREEQDCSVLGGYMTCLNYVVGADGVRQYVGELNTRKVAGYNLNIF